MTSTSRKIVVGIDGSDSASASLQWASSLAAESNGSVSAVMAWNYPTALLMPVVGTPVLPADYVADTTRTTLGEVVAATPTGDVTVEQWIVMGAPRSVLTEASEARPACGGSNRQQPAEATFPRLDGQLLRPPRRLPRRRGTRFHRP